MEGDSQGMAVEHEGKSKSLTGVSNDQLVHIGGTGPSISPWTTSSPASWTFEKATAPYLISLIFHTILLRLFNLYNLFAKMDVKGFHKHKDLVPLCRGLDHCFPSTVSGPICRSRTTFYGSLNVLFPIFSFFFKLLFLQIYNNKSI